MKKLIQKIFIFCCLVAGTFVLKAQDVPPQQQPAANNTLDAETMKQANNPLATIKTVNVHNYFIPSLYGIEDETMNQTMIRYAQPIGRFIFRATLPVVTIAPKIGSPTSGLGDFNLFAIYTLAKSKGNEFGIGPSITAPTATNDLGAGKWQAGLSALCFLANSPIIQTGGLVTWQASFAGDEEREDVNSLTAQAFFMWQIGNGNYLRSTGIWSFDLEHGTYNIPIGLGIGRVVKVGGKVFNIFAEPQYSVFAYGAAQPKFQVFIGFNTQFK